MAANEKQIFEWIDQARKEGATHIVSVCDTFSYDDYPVYVMPGDDLDEIKSKYDGQNMQRINEVIEIEYSNKPTVTIEGSKSEGIKATLELPPIEVDNLSGVTGKTINDFILELMQISEDKRNLPLVIFAPNGVDFSPKIKMVKKDGDILGDVEKMTITY